MLHLRDLTEFDESVKDYAWMCEKVSRYRNSWAPIVDSERTAQSLQRLMGVQDMDHVRKMFTQPDEAGLSFAPLAMYEKTRNVFIAEVLEGGIQIHVKATDPTAFNQKARDRELLTNRKIIETIVTQEQMSIGGPAYSISDDKDDSGNPLYSGNVKDFDEMGLDEDSSEDVGYFFQYWHRFNHEVKAEEVVNSYFNLNEVQQFLPMLVDDILAKKAVAYRVYVSESTGAIESRYVLPESVRVIRGKRKDFKDAQAIGFEEDMTIGDFLSQVGSDFDVETDLPKILSAYNYSTANNYQSMWMGPSALYPGGELLCGDPNSDQRVMWNEVLQATIKIGYIEFKTCNATAYRRSKRANYHGNKSIRKMARVTENVNDQRSSYNKEVYYNQVVYSAYYLPWSSIDQHLFKAGPMPWQMVEGAYDEIANYSIVARVERGQTFVQTAEPFARMFEKAFAKLEYEVNRAKPAGRSFSIDSIREIASQMMPTDGENKNRLQWDGFMKVVRFLSESPNSFHTYPVVDGQVLGGGATASSYELKNGLSATAGELMNVMAYADSMIDSFIGISPQRDVHAPKPREVGGLQTAATTYSVRATSYIPDMISNLLNNLALRTIIFSQDIIQFGSKAKVAYNHMLAMLGDQTVADIKSLGKVAIHRYSLNVEWRDMGRELEEIRTLTYQALQQKEIAPEQAALILSVKSPKRAIQVFAYEKKRTERRAQKIMESQSQMQQQRDAQLHAWKMEEIQQQNAGWLRREQERGSWYFEGQNARSQTDLAKTDMQVQGAAARIRQSSENAIAEAEAQADLTQQQAAPIAAQ